MPGCRGRCLGFSLPIRFQLSQNRFLTGPHMRFDTVIRNGTVVTATDTCLANVGIVGDKVTAIAAQLPTENATRVVGAGGAAEDFQTGTIAAAFGGTTTLIDFAIQY